MRNNILILLLLISSSLPAQELNIIPAPVSIKLGTQKFTLNKKTVLAARDEEDRKIAGLFNDYLEQVYHFKLEVDRQEGKNYIRLATRKFIQAPDKDAYTMTVEKDGIVIEGDTYAGTFHGIQTLIQLLPVENTSGFSNAGFSIPFLTIQDYPRFAYRGMHLDVCRHFFPVSFVKKYIDYLALHKMNYFHWHLTDDQGWRIDIKKFPNLAATGAYRNGTIIGRYPGTANDDTRYGGIYSRDDIREIVQYAADRHITVLPEIEMPGHSSAAIASYPWLSCFPNEPTVIPSHPSRQSQLDQASGRIKLVQETWGVFEDVYCAGSDSTFLFLEGVMDEVLDLFPSQYIHVGGDESPKNNWKRCAKCQARMQSLGLKNEHELQSYFIQRMEKYLNAKGRILIGWDEILEGGLAPNAIVMSWQGEKGGIEAATQQHKVIMTPQKPVYFDHAQTRNEDSLVIGGYNPIEAVYAYEPVPKELDTSKARMIMGAQANLWTEYITNEKKVEYMVFPRMSALSEVLWSPKTKRSWTDFEKRLPFQFKRYELWRSGYSNAYYDVKVSLVPSSKNMGVMIMAEPRDKKGQLTYEIEGQQPVKKYEKSFVVNRSGNLKIHYFRNDKKVNELSYDLYVNKATGKKVTISKKPNERYPGQGGAFSLVNGVYSKKGLSNPDWLGWIGDDVETKIDLGKTTAFDSLRVHTLDQNGSHVYLPEYVEVFVSANGKNYTSAGRSSSFVRDTLTMGWITVPVSKGKARYLKVVLKNYGLIPEGKPGAGNKAWVFMDEIQVL